MPLHAKCTMALQWHLDKKLQHEAVLVRGAVKYNPCCQVDRFAPMGPRSGSSKWPENTSST